MRLDHYKGLNGDVRQLIVLQNRLNIKYDSELLDMDIIDEIKLAHNKRKTVKRMIESLSLE